MVLDGSSPLEKEDEILLEMTKDKQRLILYNKADLTDDEGEGIWISASTGNIQALIDALNDLYEKDMLTEDPLISNERQIGLLYAAKEDMLRAK